MSTCYEVFLSFRGPDTRSDITDILYTGLVDAGIRAYIDDDELRTGEEIGPALLQAIEQSKILIPIFSKGYAGSKWCLMELVQMVECKRATGQKIMPIFFDVRPSEVRYQTGVYREAFDLHAKKKRFDEKTLHDWRAALSEVGALKGWDFQSKPDRGKGKFAKEVVNKVLIELKKTYLEVSDCLVDMDDHVSEIMRMISADTNEITIVGIHGMGGVGKTTCAKIVYNQISHHFEDCCFLSNIRETSQQKGIESLQNQLISRLLRKKGLNIDNMDEGIAMIKQRLFSRRVLLLLDDVDKRIQLDALLGKRIRFGKGSKLIITTRNKDVLSVPTVVWYELPCMDFDHSLQLFSRHAFRREYPLEEYLPYSVKAVKISGGLPLTLEVIGSLLSGKSRARWDKTLEKLERVLHEDVKQKLKISFEALDDRQKNIFLDIACFFIGCDKRIVIHMWESRDFFPEEAVDVLQQMSLIKIREDNRIWMHDQLRDLGREIICQECGIKSEKPSRIWNHEEPFDVLMRTKGMENVEAICLKFEHSCKDHVTYGAFANLSNLRFLQLDGVKFEETSTILHCFAQFRPFRCDCSWNVLPASFSHNSPCILPMLRWLSWHNFPANFELTTLSLTKLAILDLSRSKITEKWSGWNHIKVAKNLKVLNLTGCTNLKGMLDFSSLLYLERLILEGCQKLVYIDGSIRELKQLVFLNLNSCAKLRILPAELGKLEALTEILVDDTSIKEIPEWKGMKKLEILSARNCKYLKNCSSIGNLRPLVKLDLSHSPIEILPSSLGNMKNLKVLRVRCSFLRKLPRAIELLDKLEELDADCCKYLGGEIPSNIGRLRSLRVLRLTYTNISGVPKLPESLTSLHFASWSMKTLPDLSNLLNLRDLRLLLFSSIRDPSELEKASSYWRIGTLHKLESIFLESPYMTTLSSDLILLSQLKELDLRCQNLKCLPWVPASLSRLVIKGCWEMKTSINLSNSRALADLEVVSCGIQGIQGLEGLENLRSLKLVGVPSLEKLPDLTTLNKLMKLELRNCPKLVEIQGRLESLKILHIESCRYLEKLPVPSSFQRLEYLGIMKCEKLIDLLGSDDWRTLRTRIKSEPEK
ncbi:hypothetical protein BT93_H3772 [Corymbia citriodora subsp. variegata]|nr:hypothetical protein BT93_H3772 [Corymbia citriodora subsp. variegata]KAF8018994.1 hypothetical protein BT93_H3772 [Corymbia citriodora subsp. variegata]KAF8018995.1 hypothetical protein BT93_H3772 [Corymbia citriodora subsp. variegata]KAF8018996.1 hypothetical protein BT93_H3772 [Corymbia citriodora subsp. variegata]